MRRKRNNKKKSEGSYKIKGIKVIYIVLNFLKRVNIISMFL